MISENWLRPSLILPGVSASVIRDVLTVAVRAIAEATGVDAERAERVLVEAAEDGGFSVGKGVAVPHAAIDGLEGSAVALVITNEPIPVQALDGQPADIFFVVLSQPGAPKQHLLLLAHLARLAQSRILCDGLRQAHSAEEALSLVQAAELRHVVGADSNQLSQAATRYVALISVAGEQAIDALLVYLLDQGFDNASIFEAQSLREAATREVPLFAGFREIFGDPGGRRVIFFELEAEQVDSFTVAVRRICEEYKPEDAWVSFMPLYSRWVWQPPRVAEERTGGH